MIPEAEIRRNAGAHQIDPMIIEKDYVLGCYLFFLAEQPKVQENWIFKGGTCLRKCYFKDYRFSEDLDFTLKVAPSFDELKDLISDVNISMQNTFGIRVDLKEPVVDVIEAESGKEFFEIKVYYRGPWNYGGSPPALKLHLSRDELLIFPVKELTPFHFYSDRMDLPKIILNTYSLEEILTEKLCAISAQRKFAIARDIFDVHHLIGNQIDIDNIFNAFYQKCKKKNINPHEIELNTIIDRKQEFKTNWKNNLEYLIPSNLEVSFEIAWNRTLELLGRVLNPENFTSQN